MRCVLSGAYGTIRKCHFQDGFRNVGFICLAVDLDQLLTVGKDENRGIAQSGSAPALGAGCREFESLYPDQFFGFSLQIRQQMRST